MSTNHDGERASDAQGIGRNSSSPSECPSQDHSRILFLPTIARPIHLTGSGQSVGVSTRKPGGRLTIRQHWPGSALTALA